MIIKIAIALEAWRIDEVAADRHHHQAQLAQGDNSSPTGQNCVRTAVQTAPAAMTSGATATNAKMRPTCWISTTSIAVAHGVTMTLMAMAVNLMVPAPPASTWTSGRTCARVVAITV